MKTGIIRTIDELGRVVIPKDIRRRVNIEEGTPLEIVIDGNQLVLTKYSPESEAIRSMLDARNIVKESINELDEKTALKITESAESIIRLVAHNGKRVFKGHTVKDVIVLSSEEFEEILTEIYGEGNFETEYSMDGLWVGNNEGELPYVDDLTRHFGREVSSVHLDDCDDVGVWITFGKQGGNE